MKTLKKKRIKSFQIKMQYPEQSIQCPFLKLKDILQKKKVICQITKNLGTGFFCLLNIDNQLLRVLFNNNHVLGNDEIKIGSKIKILHEEKIKYIEITKDIFTSTNEYLDYTCIEILNDELF